MTEELELASQSHAVAKIMPEPSIGDMLRAVVEKGVSQENVGALEKLVGLYERMEERNAEKQFAQAFVALQAEIPKVQATKAVPNNDGGTRFKFAPFEEIMRQVGPMLQKHGFTVSFSQRYDDTRLIETCTLQHTGGHKRSNEFTVRIGQGPPKASQSQADGAASTYAKRFALTDALNIVVEHLDNDARLEGDTSAFITAEQVEELSQRVAMTNSDRTLFLQFAGAPDFKSILANRYEELDATLKRKERSGK